MKSAAELDSEIKTWLATRLSIDMSMNEIRDRLFELGRRLSELRDVKPRPIKKLYGLKGPTPEQLASYNENLKVWNRAYRAASKAYKEGIEISNAKHRGD